MDLGLDGKTVVVTAASKGIGLAIVRAFADEGANVVAGARTIASLEGIPRVSALALDLTVPGAPARLIAHAIERHGRLDVLVNNLGGVRLRLGGFLSLGDEEFEWAMRVNFFAALRAMRAAVAQMLAQARGAIVNIASVNAFF